MKQVAFDYCVVGGGIVGFSTARRLIEMEPHAKVVVLEKEFESGVHQTSRNSGVIHAGIYYTPGSLKAELCKQGVFLTKNFCKEQLIDYKEIGKLIVATNSDEVDRLNVLYHRAKENGIEVARIGSQELRKIEPNVSGLEAILSPKTSIVDYKKICQKLAEFCSKSGVVINYNFNLKSIDESSKHVTLVSDSGQVVKASRVSVCGGLQADRLARMSGLEADFKIIPFRGEYFRIADHKSKIVNHLIYPVPDPDLPFLGVHLTKMIGGELTVGPNAVISFAREGYTKNSLSIVDSFDFITYPGFWNLVYKNIGSAFRELKTSLFKSEYLKQCVKYCPSLNLDDLIPYRSGIRAQMVNSSGDLIHDFVFMETERVLHVCNAPSPAATSALAIGNYIVNRILTRSN